jgi:hypothetical protein
VIIFFKVKKSLFARFGKKAFPVSNAQKLARNFDSFQNIGNYSVSRRAIEFGFGAEREAMTKYGQSYIAHIVRRRKITSANRRERF